MALIKCPDCGHDMSDSAPQCLHCGYVNKTIQRIAQKYDWTSIEDLEEEIELLKSRLKIFRIFDVLAFIMFAAAILICIFRLNGWFLLIEYLFFICSVPLAIVMSVQIKVQTTRYNNRVDIYNKWLDELDK